MINPEHIEKFEHHIYRRMEAYNDALIDDPEYKKLEDRLSEAMDDIQPLIDKELFDELNHLFGELEGLYEKHGFKAGLRDGEAFRKFVDSLALPAAEKETD